MALVIEDGTDVTGADSFVTASQAAVSEVSYFGASSITDDAVGEASLRRAWVYMAALDWKADTYPLFGGTIPDAVKVAQAVFARAEFRSLGFLSPSEALSGRKTINKVDAIGWDVQSAPATIEAMRPVVTMGFDLLNPYLAKNLAQGGRTTFLDRA